MNIVQAIRYKRYQKKGWLTLSIHARKKIGDISKKLSHLPGIPYNLLLWACLERNYKLFKKTLEKKKILRAIEYNNNAELKTKENLDVFHAYLYIFDHARKKEIADATKLPDDIITIIQEYNPTPSFYFINENDIP